MIDSMIFLWLAFNSLQYLPGQVIGKMFAAIVAIPIIFAVRRQTRSLA